MPDEDDRAGSGRREGRRNAPMPGKRKLSFDIIRIVAILMVVMVHTSLNLVAYYDPQTQNAAF